jgi:hypothetical protein
MSSTVYYRVSDSKEPGVRVSIADAISKDDGSYRAKFKERVLTDKKFLKYSSEQREALDQRSIYAIMMHERKQR